MKREEIVKEIRDIARIFVSTEEKLLEKYDLLSEPPMDLKNAKNKQNIINTLVMIELNTLAGRIEEDEEYC